MTEQTRDALKHFFLTGMTPSQGNFADLIDSTVNMVQDGLSVVEKRLGVGVAQPGAKLAVQGAFDVLLTGTITFAAIPPPAPPTPEPPTSAPSTPAPPPIEPPPVDQATAIGQGSRFTQELAIGDLVQVGTTTFTVTAIADDTHMTVSPAPTLGAPASPGFTRGALMAVLDAAGAPQLIMTPTGNLGVGLATPAAKLHVAGTLMATALIGDGAAIGNLGATNIQTGTLDPARLPPISATTILGTLEVAQLPPIPADKITGQLATAQLPSLSAANLVGTLDVAQLPPIPADKITGQLATAQLPPLSAATLVGTLEVAQLPPIPADKITGQLATVQLPPLSAATLVGTLEVAQLPPIPADKITGQLGTGQLPPLLVTNLIGTLAPNQLPPIPTAHLIGPDPISPSLIPRLTADKLPPVPAALIVGPLNLDQLPSIPATKLFGPLDASLIPMLSDILRRLTALEQHLPAIQGTVTWDFANLTNAGPISRAQGQSSLPTVNAVASQTGGGPSEIFGSGIGAVLITRFCGTQFPFLDITSTQTIGLDELSFAQYHNHNFAPRTKPSYPVQLQLDPGNGFVNIGAPFIASQATNGQVTTIQLGGRVMPAGQFRLRWIPTITGGPDTNTDYFALNKIHFSFTPRPDPFDPASVVVSTVPQNPHPSIPDGMKLTALTPNGSSVTNSYPIVAFGSNTIWPYSYSDNRMSFGLVAYAANGSMLHTWEKPGARYIVGIAINIPAQTITFTGQSNATVVLTFQEVLAILPP